MRDHDERSLTGVVAPVADVDGGGRRAGGAGGRVRAAAAVPRRPGGRGDLDQRPEPGVRRPGRPARADQPGADPGAGAGAGRADAEVERAGGSTSASRSSTRCCPRGTGCTSCSRASRRGFSAVNIRKFVVRAAPARRPGRARQPEPAGGGVPRGGRAGRAQHPGRRRHPGRQDHDAQLPGGGDPGRRAGGQRRGGLRAAVHRTPTGWRCRPGRRARGDRRGPAARPGQGGAADAADPDDRRRGARRGVPRPAAGAQRRAARHVHDPRQQRPRGAGEDVHAAAAGGREHLGPVRGADGRRQRRPRRPPRHRRARRTPRQRDRRRARPGRERRHRDRADVRAAAATSCGAPAGMPPRLERFERPASTCTGSSPGRWTADGRARRARRRRRAAAGLVGVLRAAQPRRDRRDRAGPAELLARAGLGEVSIAGFLVLCVGLRRGGAFAVAGRVAARRRSRWSSG